MTNTATSSPQSLLIAKRASLLDQLATLRGGPIGRVEASDAHFGRTEDSTAQVATARELEFALDERETAELAQVEAAIKRIAQGIYGKCLDCGVEIPATRLRATPEAARCIACQQKLE